MAGHGLKTVSFDAIDADGDGKITESELETWATTSFRHEKAQETASKLDEASDRVDAQRRVVSTSFASGLAAWQVREDVFIMGDTGTSLLKKLELQQRAPPAEQPPAKAQQVLAVSQDMAVAAPSSALPSTEERYGCEHRSCADGGCEAYRAALIVPTLPL